MNDRVGDEDENIPKRVLNVTDLSGYVFCPRQYFLAKILGLRREPPEFVEGTLEHETRRLLNSILGVAYAECGPNREQLVSTAQNIADKALDYAKKIALLQHPIFSKEIEAFVWELSYRLQLEERERIYALLKVGHRPWEETVRASFPVKNEFSVFSLELQLRGRIDEVYERPDGTLAIRDIKTAKMGFPFYDYDQVQIAAYAMLLAEQESRNVVRAAIYSSRTLAERQVMVDEDLKKRVIDAGQSVRRLLANPKLPQILTGSEAVKCSVCFLREECQRLGDPDRQPRGIEALFNSEGKLSLFGDE